MDFSELSVLVVADISLDRDAVGTYTGRSREVATHPIFTITTEWLRPGGGGNLAGNLAKLGVDTWVVGTWGNMMDRDRVALGHALTRLGIKTQGMVVSGNTPTYEKFYQHNGKLVGRYDKGGRAPTEKIVQTLVSNIYRIAPNVDYCILADYDELGNGMASSEVVTAVRGLDMPRYGTSRTRSGIFHDFDWIVINNYELDMQFGGNITGITNIARAALVTLGEDGAISSDDGDIVSVPASSPGEAVDVCGCGDTFLAIFSASIMSGMSRVASMELAAKGAGIVATRKFGTAYPSHNELWGG